MASRDIMCGSLADEDKHILYRGVFLTGAENSRECILLASKESSHHVACQRTLDQFNLKSTSPWNRGQVLTKNFRRRFPSLSQVLALEAHDRAVFSHSNQIRFNGVVIRRVRWGNRGGAQVNNLGRVVHLFGYNRGGGVARRPQNILEKRDLCLWVFGRYVGVARCVSGLCDAPSRRAWGAREQRLRRNRVGRNQPRGRYLGARERSGQPVETKNTQRSVWKLTSYRLTASPSMPTANSGRFLFLDPCFWPQTSPTAYALPFPWWFRGRGRVVST